MYRLNLNPTTGRHHAPTLGDEGEQIETIEVLPTEEPLTAPVAPIVPAEPTPVPA